MRANNRSTTWGLSPPDPDPSSAGTTADLAEEDERRRLALRAQARITGAISRISLGDSWFAPKRREVLLTSHDISRRSLSSMTSRWGRPETSCEEEKDDDDAGVFAAVRGGSELKASEPR
jgi:hypothetical protein